MTFMTTLKSEWVTSRCVYTFMLPHLDFPSDCWKTSFPSNWAVLQTQNFHYCYFYTFSFHFLRLTFAEMKKKDRNVWIMNKSVYKYNNKLVFLPTAGPFFIEMKYNFFVFFPTSFFLKGKGGGLLNPFPGAARFIIPNRYSAYCGLKNSGTFWNGPEMSPASKNNKILFWFLNDVIIFCYPPPQSPPPQSLWVSTRLFGPECLDLSRQVCVDSHWSQAAPTQNGWEWVGADTGGGGVHREEVLPPPLIIQEIIFILIFLFYICIVYGKKKV